MVLRNLYKNANNQCLQRESEISAILASASSILKHKEIIEEKPLELGLRGVLKKPLDRLELATTIRRVLDENNKTMSK